MSYQVGDKIRFDYHGSQEEFAGTRQDGTVVLLVPHVEWAGGIVPLDEVLTGHSDGIARNVETVSA